MSELIYTPTHIYTSAKGDTFLSWDDWMKINATDEELEAYLDPSMTNDIKNGAYARWIEDEKITTHSAHDADGNVIFTETF